MTIKDLEMEKLEDWFRDKYSGICYEEAYEELREKKKNQGFWKRNTISEEERLWLLNRTIEILNKAWEDSLK
jgi:hypothetical protein